MIICDACGMQHDRTPRTEPDLTVCSQDCLIDYVAEAGHLAAGVACIAADKKDRCVLSYCNWCHEPFAARKGRTSFCCHRCSTRARANDVPPRPTDDRPPTWWAARRVVFKRDGNQCQFCGKPSGLIGRRPNVARIDDDEAVVPSNLVCLCPSCYEKDNGRRTIAERAAEAGPFNHDFDAHLCPSESCSPDDRDSWFDTYKGLAHHYYKQHEENDRGTVCQSCGTPIQHYASRRKEPYCDSCYEDQTKYENVACHDCGERFLKISSHWTLSDCSFPTITDTMLEQIRGYALGAGNARSVGLNPSIRLSVSEKVAPHITDTLGPLGALRPNASDCYTVRIRPNPSLNEVDRWLKNGHPPVDNLSFTPTLLRSWYVANGVLRTQDETPILRLSKSLDTTVVTALADEIQAQTPLTLNAPNSNVRRLVLDTSAFFEYIGEPPAKTLDNRWP